MSEVKYVPVFTVRLPLAESGLLVVGQAQFMLDARVDRRLLVAILKAAIPMIEGGLRPDRFAGVKL